MLALLLAALTLAGPLDAVEGVERPLERGMARYLEGGDATKKIAPFVLEPMSQERLGTLQMATHEAGARVFDLLRLDAELFLFKGEEVIVLDFGLHPDQGEVEIVELSRRMVHSAMLGFEPPEPSSWGELGALGPALAGALRSPDCATLPVGDPAKAASPTARHRLQAARETLQRVCNEMVLVTGDRVGLRFRGASLELAGPRGPLGTLRLELSPGPDGVVVHPEGYVPTSANP